LGLVWDLGRGAGVNYKKYNNDIVRTD
jgi:hypothetical protein